tara:strand:- start:231 stop:1106 length:876 start_codon:yes stop_codon:yes gene_type:complete
LIGIISAFGAALSWTYACFIWRTQTEKYQSIDINLVKNIVAFLIFLPAFIDISLLNDLKSIITLLLSGVIGIGLGDTFYIKSLQVIGTRKTLSIETLSPLLAALSGEIFINENLALRSYLGIVIISISLLFLLRQNSNHIVSNQSKSTEQNNLKIYIFPLLSVLCAVFGGLLSRMVFLERDLSPFQTTEIRLLGAIIFLITIKNFKVNFFLKKLKNNDQKRFLISIFLGTNLGILLQQVVFKTLPFGIGWTLLSTSPLISLFFATKEEGKISKGIIFFTTSLFLGICLIIL